MDIWDCREVCLDEAVTYVFSFENYKGITAKLLRTRRGLMPYTLYSIKFSISQQYCWNTHLVPKVILFKYVDLSWSLTFNFQLRQGQTPMVGMPQGKK